MLQSPQVSDNQLIRACLTNLYSDLMALALLLLGERQKAFNAAADAICDAVHQRRHYWAGISGRAWVYRFLLRRCRQPLWGASKLSRAALRLVLCDALNLQPVEAAGVLGEKPAHAEERLQHARQHPPAELPALLAQVNSNRQPLDPEQLDQILVVILQESARLLRLAASWSRIRQAALVVLVLVGALGFYRVWLGTDRPTPAPAPAPTLSAGLPAPTQAPPASPTPDPTPTLSAGPVQRTNQGEVYLKGICSLNLDSALDFYPNFDGPDSLTAVLNYWNTPTDPAALRSELQPAPDGEVSLLELRNYADAQGLKSVFGLAGDTRLLRRLVDAGYPVIVEVGQWTEVGWRSRVLVVCGYQSYAQNFITAQPEPAQGWRPVIAFDQLKFQWDDLNGPYLVVYDPQAAGTQQKLKQALGQAANARASFELARDQAAQVIATTANSQRRFFAEFNYATALYYLYNFDEAALAYDRAFESLALLPDDTRPDHILWFQTQPYQAYYASGQFERIVELANQVIEAAGGPAPENSFYWRGSAYARLGRYDEWLADLQSALQANPNYLPAQEDLDRFNGR